MTELEPTDSPGPAAPGPERSAWSRQPLTDPPADGASGAFDGEITVTGQPSVDNALAPLSELSGYPTAAHVAVYERVHRDLHEVLAELDRAH